MTRAASIRSRCKIDGAVARLGLEPRTVRNMAAAGDIPGAAKFRDIWTFDIALLDAFVTEKERETCQNSRRPPRVVTGGTAFSMAGFNFPTAKTTDGHYKQTIQKLRETVAKRSAGA
jgi:hypothetical protein